MPTIIRKRVWCKTCQDYCIHQQNVITDKLICKECKTEYEPTSLSEIPDEKIQEQRKRYIEWNKQKKKKFFSELINPMARLTNEFGNMFSPPGNDVEFYETDAGQRDIDKKIEEEYEKIREQKKQEHEKKVIEYNKFKHTQRNDTCPCGSGLKYKKCCYNKWSNFQI